MTAPPLIRFVVLGLACAASLAWMPWITGCNNDALHSTPNTTQDTASGLYLVPKGLTPEAVSGLFTDSVGQGKPLVVDFTSRFCYECRQLKPKLEALAKTYPDITFQLVSIQSKDAHDQALLNAFHVTTVPYVAFIDGSGQVKKVVIDNTSPDDLALAAESIRTQTAAPPATAEAVPGA
ncbi:MAG: thioredoxin family protein [Cyanobacteria bacterium HKST-UBA03]|nr:thioredoxin family protein [Cyanobacteria bacterium HKST-UBA03]